MPTIEVNEQVFGWGEDIANLPTDPMAAGAKVVDIPDAELLNEAAKNEGWILSAERDGETVYLVAPKAWKRPVEISDVGPITAVYVGEENVEKGDEQPDPPDEGQEPPDEPSDAGVDPAEADTDPGLPKGPPDGEPDA